MNPKTLFLTAGILSLLFYYSCSKNTNPQPPIHDTVTLVKNDTLLVPKLVDTPNLTNGLVLYLTFNGSWADSSGLANTVTPLGGAVLGYDMHGYSQSAFNSSGNGARLVVANNGSYAVDTAFSVSFDFMIRSSPYYNGGNNYDNLMCLMSIVNTANGEGPTFAVGMVNPALPQNFQFSLSSSTSDCNEANGAILVGNADTTNFIPQLGSWYNAICTFTKGTASVYINGQLMGTKTLAFNSVLFCPSASLVIGGWWNNSQENINGEMDEVRMYNRTLTAPQIAWLSRNFQTTSTKTTPGLKSSKLSGISSN
jgi:Concanavalin A-like lectin/glucanases superfamily